ncbi:hypothetical protein SAMN05216226_103124 [Halovenus aranensis]|uniref:Uncharacterized protein n=1 Tax=Halovenus aranensis TaxID=890420 RepID=A0A1G8TKL8_9EURY|nr:DUF5813 family protein [Halovenus aranensis]SDJ42116.1 hypothetical protein SAMN05216226_103124 [Halovenus aranensis]
MSDESRTTSERLSRAVTTHDALEMTDDGFEVTTTVFEGTVTVDETAEPSCYTVEVTAPTLRAATADEVGPTVATDWFETLERRLESAPQATRTTVELDEFGVEKRGDSVVVTFEFTLGTPRTAVDVTKTFVEFVEGTYVEGVVPGYDYQPPVADLLADASQGETSGGTPL